MKLCIHKNCTYRCCRLHWVNRKFDNVPLFDMTADPICKKRKDTGTMLDTLDEKKKCQVVCIETGIIYKNSEEAAVKVETSALRIRKCCRGEIQTAGGHRWKYVV